MTDGKVTPTPTERQRERSNCCTYGNCWKCRQEYFGKKPSAAKEGSVKLEEQWKKETE